MSQSKVASNAELIIFPKLADYQQLVKLRLTLTVVFSAVMAYAIALQGSMNWVALVVLALGGFFVTGAANALNQVLEKDYDKMMKRTADRPLAAGRMSVSEAVMAAGMMSLAGITLLAMFNPWAALFGTLALLTYAYIYTPLKRVSTVAIPVGAVAGALPMLIGCVAFQGSLTWLALYLFALQFFWQFPHFHAIGWLGFDEYDKAGYKLLPTVDGKRDPHTGLYAAAFALALLPMAWVPFWMGLTGLVSAVVLSGLAVGFTWFGWNLYRRQDRKAALMLMFASLLYLPVGLVVLFLDKI